MNGGLLLKKTNKVGFVPKVDTAHPLGSQSLYSVHLKVPPELLTCSPGQQLPHTPHIDPVPALVLP